MSFVSLLLAASFASAATNEATIFKMDDAKEGSFCSASAVTADGYLLTALHCVRSCLLEAGAAEEAANVYLGLDDLFVVKNPTDVNVVCTSHSIPALGAKSVRVVATGQALTLYSANFMSDNSGLFNELKGKGWTAKSQDFAILKIDAPPGLRCLRVSDAALNAGETLFSVGYPVAPEGQPVVLKASEGVRYARGSDSVAFKSHKTKLDRTWVTEQFESADLLFSNASNTYGQSGGPVVDTQGRIRGVTSGFATPLGSDDVHELVAPTWSAIQRGLGEELAHKIEIGNTHCE